MALIKSNVKLETIKKAEALKSNIQQINTEAGTMELHDDKNDQNFKPYQMNT